MFLDMRQSDIYAFKRVSMKIQYEILSIGLKQSMMDISKQYADKQPIECQEENYDGIFYYRFSKYFVDNKHNLKDIMVQVSAVNEDSEQKIKEELLVKAAVVLHLHNL